MSRADKDLIRDLRYGSMLWHVLPRHKKDRLTQLKGAVFTKENWENANTRKAFANRLETVVSPNYTSTPHPWNTLRARVAPAPASTLSAAAPEFVPARRVPIDPLEAQARLTAANRAGVQLPTAEENQLINALFAYPPSSSRRRHNRSRRSRSRKLRNTHRRR